MLKTRSYMPYCHTVEWSDSIKYQEIINLIIHITCSNCSISKQIYYQLNPIKITSIKFNQVIYFLGCKYTMEFEQQRDMVCLLFAQSSHLWAKSNHLSTQVYGILHAYIYSLQFFCWQVVGLFNILFFLHDIILTDGWQQWLHFL